MKMRTIGQGARQVEVGEIGLGLMTFDQAGAPPREQLLETVRTALDAGVTLFDSADAYGPRALGSATHGANETLIASLLDELGVRDRVLLATKGGSKRTDDGHWRHDSSSEYLHAAVDASLRRLGVDQIELWQHHRPDPTRDYQETIGILSEIAATGKVARIGLSNVNPVQIRAAHAVLGEALVSVQNQFGPQFRSSRPEIEACQELGIAFLAWRPVGGLGSAKDLARQSTAFAEVADARGVSVYQVAVAWSLAQAPVMIPLVGARRSASIADSAGASQLQLTASERAALDAS
ncbi:MAG: aldo/keto reductase [Beutenbergiaceae bacterium]